MAQTAVITSKKANGASPTWEELLGSKNWEGLLEPELDLSLREFIIRCGDFCQATRDAFNSNPTSANCGNSNYGMETFFTDAILPNASRYRVVSFIYATSGLGTSDKNHFVHPQSTCPDKWDTQSNWMGFVAVTTDKVSGAIGHREIYVAWRGTVTDSEWESNIFGAKLVSAQPILSTDKTVRLLLWPGFNPNEPKVHEGWLSIYTSENTKSSYVKSSARVQLHTAIEALKNKYKDEKITVVVTGHSLGGSMATLSAFDLAENNVVSDDVQVSAFVFGCPQVGNEAFKDRVEKHQNLKILSVKNVRDLIPRTPDWFLKFYVPIQTAELEIDTNISPYLKHKACSMEVVWDDHNLQAYLHIVAGWNGFGKEFDPNKYLKRSFALVNKWGRFLISDLHVPESWWVERNKGMVYDEITGEWNLDPPPPANQMLRLAIN